MNTNALDKEEVGIAMFRIRRQQKGTEKLEFLGFKPIYECEEWELFHLKRDDYIWFDADISQSNFRDELDREILSGADYEIAILTGIASIEVESDEFNSDEDYEFDTIYTKLIEDLEDREKEVIFAEYSSDLY